MWFGRNKSEAKAAGAGSTPLESQLRENTQTTSQASRGNSVVAAGSKLEIDRRVESMTPWKGSPQLGEHTVVRHSGIKDHDTFCTEVLLALNTVKDPDLKDIGIVNFGLVAGMVAEGGKSLDIYLRFSSTVCPEKDRIQKEADKAIREYLKKPGSTSFSNVTIHKVEPDKDSFKKIPTSMTVPWDDGKADSGHASSINTQLAFKKILIASGFIKKGQLPDSTVAKGKQLLLSEEQKPGGLERLQAASLKIMKMSPGDLTQEFLDSLRRNQSTLRSS